jgi:peptidoglycan glycosyltransferase
VRERNSDQKINKKRDLESIDLDIGKDVRAIRSGNYEKRQLEKFADMIRDEAYDDPEEEYDSFEDQGEYDEYDSFEEPDEAYDFDGKYPDDAFEKETLSRSKKKRGRNRTYAFISYVFVMIFLSLIAYVVYFNVKLRSDILNSPYNKRQDTFAEYVTRGEIISADGAILAQTVENEEGSEERVYPYGNEYAHVVGYASNGKSGIESIENYTLLTSHETALNQIKNELFDEKNMGDSVHLTIDSRLQDAAYQALGDWQGAIVVIEPKTGKILAMVSKPDFDPNTISEMWNSYVEDSSSSVLVNRATQGRYAPGSTFKIVTALSYLRDCGSFDGFHFNCEGTLTSEGHSVHCFEGNAHGEEDFEKAFENSCNCAFSTIGLELGGNSLKSTAESLLFNKPLPAAGLNYNESSFTLDNKSGNALIMQTAFGQGETLVSPLHMALIVSAVANDGKVMEPYLVDHVESCYKDVVSSAKEKVYRQIMSEEEASALKGLMEKVVTGGTAQLLSGQPYSAAGKTGSAEYNRADGSIGTHSWFVGFSNVEDPDIAVAIIAEDAGSGSGTAVPIAKQIFDTYYSVVKSYD